MSNLNVNCFGECLNSLEDEGENPQIFKNRKGRKCLTLVRKPKRLFNPNNLDTNQSTTLEKTQPESRQLQLPPTPTFVPAKITHIEHTKPIQHPHIIYGRYSAGPPQQSASPRYYLPPTISTQRERRLSEACSGSCEPNHKRVQDRSNSLGHNKIIPERREIKPIILPVQTQSNHFNSVIREEHEFQKRSSLFQGAKSILSKLVSSYKNTEKREQLQPEPPLPQTAQKANFQIRSFYDNARLCETRHAINNTHSTIKTEHYQEGYNLHLSHQLSIDALPMSPKSKTISKHKDIRIGKLLGVGKWSHVYLCQEVRTSLIYSFKEIFKQSLQYPVTVERIHLQLEQAMEVSHPKIISIYSKMETSDKIYLVLEYCTKSVYEELKQKTLLSLSEIKSYMTDLIEGLVYLHENDSTHGNINIFSTFIIFSECKLKPNFTEIEDDSQKSLDFKTDITSLAIVLHEMAYGVSSQVAVQQTLYEKEKIYREKGHRKALVNEIRLKIQKEKARPEYAQLNSFIGFLLNWTSEVRLTSGVCLSHPFFRDQTV